MKLFVGLAAVSALGFAPAALAQDAPSGVYVDSFSAGGNGCAPGTVTQNLSPDAKALTLLFDNFLVDSSANRGREVKKSCRVNMRLAIPPGWAYTLFSVDYRGFASLGDDDESRLRSWYSLDGSQQIRISNLKMEGPYQADYLQRAWVPLDTLPWLACNRTSSNIVIDTEIMTNGDSAMMTVDSVDGELRQQYGVAWRRCSNSVTWAGRCEVVLESVWGSDMNRFRTTGVGRDHMEAKESARSAALAQCEAERSRLRPLMRGMTRCVTDEPVCLATPQ